MIARYRNSISLVIVLSLLPALSASQIPNGGFETWGNGDLSGWGTSNDPDGNFFNVFQSTSAHGGSSAVRGLVVRIENHNIQPVIQSGPDGEGFAYTTRAASFSGFYQLFPVGGDRISINVVLSIGGSGGTPIAFAAAVLPTAAATYTPFTVPFQYFSGANPTVCIVQIMIVGPTVGDVHEGSIYIMDDITLDGTTGVDGHVTDVPVATGLNQNYPNPFNPTTNVQYSIADRQFSTLKVFDVLGHEVAMLVNEVKEPGTYNVQFDAKGLGLSSGVYFYRLQAGDFVQTKRLMLLK